MAKSSDRNVTPPATAEQILGRPLDAAERDPASVVAGKKIEARWRAQYRRLLEIRDGIIDQETRLQSETVQKRPQFVPDPAAESANAAFEQDKAFGRVSAYQDMLDEVNQALSRIENGSYGLCELTGRPINPDRLEAIPWARFSREAEEQLEQERKAPVHFDLSPPSRLRDGSLGARAERGEPRAQADSQSTVRERTAGMPAKSKQQQKAAGAALAARRGEQSKSSLRGASKSMASSMSKKELEKMASAKRKNLPKRAGSGKSSSRKSSSKKSGAKSKSKK